MVDTYKYFKYDISDFSGYRKILEKSNIKSFKKIKFDGFEILSEESESFKYKIAFKLIRNLKLKKLNDKIRIKSIEDNILDLLEKSQEISETWQDHQDQFWFYRYDGSEYFYEDKSDKKLQDRYRKRHFNRQVKNRL